MAMHDVHPPDLSLSQAESVDASDQLCAQVQAAQAEGRPLVIQGSGSKACYGRPVAGEVLDSRVHRGIVHYDPVELILTARAGTPLAQVEAALAAQGQYLPFEPPHLGAQATLGGCIATGLSGPRRPWAGPARDYVLGTRVLTATGKVLRFGGEVMKNVAGYDVSRLMVGAQGTLGLITEISLKVLPQPAACAGLALEMPLPHAFAKLARWGRQPLPLTAACWSAGRLYLRLEGGERSVAAARSRLGGDSVDSSFWQDLREQRLPVFQPRAGSALWRLALPANVPELTQIPGDWLYDWGGTQRWLQTSATATEIRQTAQSLGGHATCLTPGAAEPWTPLAPALARYHQRLKDQLDPRRIFNPGRLYPDL